MLKLKRKSSIYVDADEFDKAVKQSDLTSQEQMDIEIIRWSVSLDGGYINTVFGNHCYTNVENLLESPNTKTLMTDIINGLPKYKRDLWGFYPIEDPIDNLADVAD